VSARPRRGRPARTAGRNRAAAGGVDFSKGGQGVIFPVRERPVPSTRGYKRVIMKHGVSTVHSGRRFVLGVIFHNAR
jgi:hypothetical protein